MKIYTETNLNATNLNATNLNATNLSNISKNISYYKLIYSNDGIFKIMKNKIYKIKINDIPVKIYNINEYKLLLDKSSMFNENNITTIPLTHKLFNITEIKYKLTNELSLLFQYNNNNLFDSYFESNIFNNDIQNSIYESIKLYNLI